jgi:hypothetical protein
MTVLKTTSMEGILHLSKRVIRDGEMQAIGREGSNIAPPRGNSWDEREGCPRVRGASWTTEQSL